ncbi:UNVERIFIED_CONTAM: hypothetical protein RMT77_011255 [Armadillidium vulgare]
MAEKIPNVEELLKEAQTSFKSEFGTDPDVGVVAPGRVNLIGEHTDYNEGFVFPMALPLVTILVGRKSSEKEKIRIKTLSRNVSDSSLIEFIIPSDVCTMQPSDSSWVNYVKGLVANFHTHAPGFDAVVVSSVPLGGGLSSSAALEVATYTFLEAITGSFAKSPADKALACQKAEHEFAKVPCGIMDQFISTMGAEGSALLIDCRSLKSTLFPLKNPLVSIVIINSNVKHALTGSEYPARRNQCHSAAKLMKKNSLREATLEDLEKFENEMDEEMRKRVHHVITEIERTEKAASALEKEDFTLFGRLMNESHESLKDKYEVSCPEVDELVQIAQSVPGVFGSRMTGGGFGGCTVTLVSQDKVEELINTVNEKYSGKATFYVCSPSSGAKILFNHTSSKTT